MRHLILLTLLVASPFGTWAEAQWLARCDESEKRDPPYPRRWESDLGSLRGKAKQGDALAQCELALHYIYGVATPQDLPAAVLWLGKAADQQFPMAQYTLGILYRSGAGVEMSHATAEEWFLRAADHGYVPAQHEAALTADRKGQRRLAMALLRTAAQKGFPSSQHVLGCVTSDPVDSYMWLSLAAPNVESARIQAEDLRKQLSKAQLAAAEKNVRNYQEERARARKAKQ